MPMIWRMPCFHDGELFRRDVSDHSAGREMTILELAEIIAGVICWKDRFYLRPDPAGWDASQGHGCEPAGRARPDSPHRF
jgi:hypothetical protein